MEELSTWWKKLTLFESEENRVALRSSSKKREIVLAGKIFTRKTLNVEAVGKTFRPLWRTKGGFNVTIGGENILLFAFELEVDAERVIQGAPWAFDRHLVVFERFDGYTSIQSLGFKKTAFWVQIHNLPFSLQTVDTAISIGETIGSVIKPKDLGEMLGANFMRVRVIVDVSKPLCRGRKISWDVNCEGWAAFMYERLPNICYWCGSISHDDKDCSLWLHSKGTLKTEDQQFGPWIRAPFFNSTKKAFVEVKGYDTMNYGMEGLMTFQGTRVVNDASTPHSRLNILSTQSTSHINSNDDIYPPEGRSMADATNVSSLVTNSMVLLEDGTHAAVEYLCFEEQLRALDKEINYCPGSSKLKPDFHGFHSVADPLISNATSSLDMSTPSVLVHKQKSDFVGHDAGREMESLDFNRTGFPSTNNPIISHDTSSMDVSKPPVHATKNNSDFIGHEVEREVDSLETTRADKFEVGCWTPINKEKQGTRGRPKKSVQEARFNNATLTLSSPSKFAQPTRNSKRTWKRVVVETLNSSETKDGSLDLEGKRKGAESE